MSAPIAIAPADLPSLPLDERRALPDTAAIYVAPAGDTVRDSGHLGTVR